MGDGLAFRDLCVRIIWALEVPDEGSDCIIQGLRCREVADPFYFGDNYVNILDGALKFFGCVAGSLSAVPVKLEQADAIFTPCGVMGHRIEAGFGNGVR